MKVYRSLLVGLSLILGVRAQIPASNPLDSLISQGKTAADAGAAQGKAAGESAIGEASKLLPKRK